MNTILTPEKYGELKTRFPRFNEPWSQEETDYLREMAEMNYPQSLMAQDLGRSPNSIRMRLKALGLYTPKPAPKPWKEDDDRRLVALYLEDYSFQDLAAIFGRSENAVISRLVRLRAGLRPSLSSPSDDKSDYPDDRSDYLDDFSDIP